MSAVKGRQLRQQRLMVWLEGQNEPIRGEDLARRLGVTRQVVVHEIALLRAQGVPIVSTPRGYYWDRGRNTRRTAILSVRHTADQTAQELTILVDHGLIVQNVIVEHPLYGELTGALEIRSRVDVAHFLEQLQRQRASLLLSLTNGYHMHTVEYWHEEALSRAIDALLAHGIQVFS
jgi:transcriptional regulator of NAD metabolism